MLGLTVDNLTKRFPNGALALAGISLQIQPGEGVVLLGANGSGKSTLLRCIAGLEQPTTGQIRIGQVNDPQTPGRRRRLRSQIGFVFQRFHLVGNLSAFHNVLHGALGRSRGPWYWLPATAPVTERAKAMTCLAAVGLDALAHRRADTLSGGQQQRLAIARTLMQEPQLILADEPVASLDPKAGREVMELLWQICHERGLTILCALHQVDLALRYGERLIALQSGRLVLDAPVKTLTRSEVERIYSQPNAPLTATSTAEQPAQPANPALTLEYANDA
jgi:phosphonate transport system ATP-binding protein